MAKTDFKSVDEYITTLPEDVQAILQRVRSTIRKAVPGAEEVISYQIPAYKLPAGPVLYFAGWKRHYSLYPATGRMVAAFKDDLAPYEVDKGTIRFPLSQPVPVKLIERIAKFRAKETATRARAKRAGPKKRVAAPPLIRGVRRTTRRAHEKARGDVMNPKDALAFVEKHGVVLQAARSSIPSLAEAVAGERIRGSWWGHPRGKEIFHAAQAVCESPDVLVCKLVEGKITYVHRRLWPALVKLSSRFPRAQLARVWEEHTPSGAHRSRRLAFPAWVPADVARQAERLTVSEAEATLSSWPTLGRERTEPKRARS